MFDFTIFFFNNERAWSILKRSIQWIIHRQFLYNDWVHVSDYFGKRSLMSTNKLLFQLNLINGWWFNKQCNRIKKKTMIFCLKYIPINFPSNVSSSASLQGKQKEHKTIAILLSVFLERTYAGYTNIAHINHSNFKLKNTFGCLY